MYKRPFVCNLCASAVVVCLLSLINLVILPAHNPMWSICTRAEACKLVRARKLLLLLFLQLFLYFCVLIFVLLVHFVMNLEYSVAAHKNQSPSAGS